MNLKQQKGFTLLELVVSSVIIVLLLSFVLANFRTARYSGELDISLKLIESGVTDARVKGYSGNLIDNPFAGQPGQDPEIYPSIGYAVKFDISTPEKARQLSVYAKHGGVELEERITNLNDVIIESLCFNTETDLTNLDPPCAFNGGTQWFTAGASIEVVFDLDGRVEIFRENGGKIINGGGSLRHQRTNQRAYFYIQEGSGLAITGEK